MNFTLKNSAHSGYDAAFADWDVSNGVGRLGNLKTLDNQLPGRIILPSRPYYVGFLAARASKYVRFPDTAYLYQGFWLNNGAASYWIQGANPFAVSGSVNGSPATTIDRKYRVFARTDRATSFLSSELDLANAPTDAAFNAGASVSLTWARLADVGIISYDVYRKTGATFELLQQVESGANTYLDNNVVLDGASGYPTATDDRSTSLTTTRLGVLNGVAIDGTSPQWSTFSSPVRVAHDFNSSLGDQQWLRIGLGGLPDGTADFRVKDAMVAGAAVTITDTVFTAGLAGKNAQLTDDAGIVTNNTVAGFVSSTQITLGTPVATGTYTVVILGGADDHSLLIDCVHVSPADGAVFAPSDQDLVPPRPQQPRAAPHTANQGGGSGGTPSDGGGPENPDRHEDLGLN